MSPQEMARDFERASDQLAIQKYEALVARCIADFLDTSLTGEQWRRRYSKSIRSVAKGRMTPAQFQAMGQ